jgi:hypothetical protein
MFLKHFGRRLRTRSSLLLQRGHSFGFGTLGVQVWPQKGHLTVSLEGPAKDKSPTRNTFLRAEEASIFF